jgi:tripartite-type tricarboxylate transporter receptor subunit TctC
VPYDPVKDFQFVSLIGTAGLIMVAHPDAPAKTVAEVIAAAKANPGKLNFGNAGVGTTQHFSAELFGQLAGIQVKHIPYRSTPAAIAALRSMEIDYLFELVQTVRGQISAGDLKPVGVTSPQRFPAVPDVPTISEGGLAGYDVTSWYGLALPAGTPPAIVEKLNKAMREALNRDTVKKQIADAGAIVKSSSPDEFSKHIANEIAKWKGVMAKAGLQQM